MSGHPDAIGSPYTAVDHHWPIQLEFDGSERPVKLLIKESWYSIAEPIYDWYSRLSLLLGPIDLDEIKLPDLPEIPVELDGLGITVFLIKLVISSVIWAAKHGIKLSRFELHRGWAGSIGLGWTPMGPVLYREC